MGFGGRQDVWVGGGNTKWDMVGGRMCGWEEGSQNGIWREAGCVDGRGGSTKRDLAEAGCVGGRREHKMRFGVRQDV